MDNLTPLLVIFALSNKSGFESIRQAIDAADGFSKKLGNITNIMNILPRVSSMISGIKENGEHEQYVDTLKDIISKLS